MSRNCVCDNAHKHRALSSLRDEIAECSSSSYDNLSLDSLQKMMLFSTREELLAYIGEFRVRLSLRADCQGILCDPLISRSFCPSPTLVSHIAYHWLFPCLSSRRGMWRLALCTS
jgi:hypothetical protein